MTIIQEIGVLVCLIFFAESVVWIKRGCAMVTWKAFRGFSIRTPPEYASNNRGGLVLLPVMPPLLPGFVLQPWALCFSPEGFCVSTNFSDCWSLDAEDTSQVDVLVYGYDLGASVTVNGDQIMIEGERLVACPNQREAIRLTSMVRLMSRLTSPEQRGRIIRRQLAKHLDPLALKRTMECCLIKAGPLSWCCNMMWLLTFIILPAFLIIRGPALFPWAWTIAVLGALFIAALYYQEQRELSGGENAVERLMSVVKYLLIPPAAIRAMDDLFRNETASFHPLAGALAYPKTNEARIRLVIARARNPVNSEEETNIHRWMRECFVAETERILASSGLEPVELTTCPSGDGEFICPRCGSQFVSDPSVCPDCSGVQTVRQATQVVSD